MGGLARGDLGREGGRKGRDFTPLFILEKKAAARALFHLMGESPSVAAATSANTPGASQIPPKGLVEPGAPSEGKGEIPNPLPCSSNSEKQLDGKVGVSQTSPPISAALRPPEGTEKTPSAASREAVRASGEDRDPPRQPSLRLGSPFAGGGLSRLPMEQLQGWLDLPQSPGLMLASWGHLRPFGCPGGLWQPRPFCWQDGELGGFAGQPSLEQSKGGRGVRINNFKELSNSLQNLVHLSLMSPIHHIFFITL